MTDANEMTDDEKIVSFVRTAISLERQRLLVFCRIQALSDIDDGSLRDVIAELEDAEVSSRVVTGVTDKDILDRFRRWR